MRLSHIYYGFPGLVRPYLYNEVGPRKIELSIYHLSIEKWQKTQIHCHTFIILIPDSKVHGDNMGPIWGRQDPGGPHVGPTNFVIWDCKVASAW